MPRLPFPAISGRKASLYHYCRIIHELGYRLIVAAFLEMGDNPDNKPDSIDELIILPQSSGKEKIKRLVVDTFLRRKYPIQVSIFLSGKAKKIIDDTVQKHQPFAIIADMVRTTEYITDVPTYRVADLDDTLSLRYERQLKQGIGGVNPYGQFINVFPKFVRKILLFGFIKLWVNKTEIRLLKEYEINIAKACDKVVFVAAKEAETLNLKLGEPEKAVAIPIGVDTGYYSTHAAIPHVSFPDDGGVYLGIHGQMTTAHNENTAMYFIKEILPYIIRENSNVKLLCIGGGVSENLKSLNNPNVVFTDFVDDVRSYLMACKVYVCPMQFGSGIKTKLLEAMSMGLPVVTSSTGAENIDAVDGTDFIITDEPRKFAEEVLALLSDEKKAQRLSGNAIRYINNNWTWKRAKAEFEKLFAKIQGEEMV
jgi:glycosyltransferase involved in cell wall biosynthesis